MVVSGSEPPADDRLGEILISAGIVASHDISEALQVSKRLHTKLGRVLLASECIDEAKLNAALEAQASVRRGANIGAATDSLRLSIDRSISFRDAAKELDHRKGPVYWCQTIGFLLLEAQILTADQLTDATAVSFAEGVPVTSVLIRWNALTTDFLQFVDKIYKELCELKITREDFVARTKEAHRLWSKAGISK